jgi:hypothetical protein
MRFDGHALQGFAHVRPLHYVLQDFAGLGFDQFPAPGELGRPLEFHRHGQSRLAVLLFGAAENPPAIRPKISRVPVLRIRTTMYACHNAANHTANVRLCQQGFFMLFLLVFLRVCRAGTKDGFDSRTRYQPGNHGGGQKTTSLLHVL